MTPESLKVTGGISGYRPGDCATARRIVRRAVSNMSCDACDGTSLWRFHHGSQRVDWLDGETEQPSAYGWVVIGVVENTLQHGGTLPMKVLRACLVYLRRIVKDTAWLDSWDSPTLIRRSVAAYTELFTALLEDAKPRKTKHKVRGKYVIRKRTEIDGWYLWPEVKLSKSSQGSMPHTKGWWCLGQLPNGDWRALFDEVATAHIKFTKTIRVIECQANKLMDAALKKAIAEEDEAKPRKRGAK